MGKQVKELESRLSIFRKKKDREPDIVLVQREDIAIDLVRWCNERNIMMVVQKQFVSVTFF